LRECHGDTDPLGGRRKKDEQPPPERRTHRASTKIEDIDEFQVEPDLERESFFIWITNLLNAKKHSASSILKEYKQRLTAGAGFSFTIVPISLVKSFQGNPVT
jgi:hypothetical protein